MTLRSIDQVPCALSGPSQRATSARSLLLLSPRLAHLHPGPEDHEQREGRPPRSSDAEAPDAEATDAEPANPETTHVPISSSVALLTGETIAEAVGRTLVARWWVLLRFSAPEADHS
jgi:hypothetical protein